MKLSKEKQLQVKGALAGKGKSLSTIARRLKKSPQYVWQVFKGIRNARDVQIAIARAAGIPINDLWPK